MRALKWLVLSLLLATHALAQSYPSPIFNKVTSLTAPTFSSLTGYTYANGAGAVTATTTIPVGSVVNGGLPLLTATNIWTGVNTFRVLGLTPTVDAAAVLSSNTTRTAYSIYSPIVPANWYFYGANRSVLEMTPGTTVQGGAAYDAYIYNATPQGAVGNQANAVGAFLVGISAVDNASTWGINTSLNDNTVNGLATLVGRTLIGWEGDFQVNGASTVEGLSMIIQGAGTPIGANGVQISRTAGATAQWAYGLVIDNGAAANAIITGALATSGTSVAGQPILMRYFDAASLNRSMKIQPVNDALLFTASHLANGLSIQGVSTGNIPTLGATGSDTNIGIKLLTKGTGSIIGQSQGFNFGPNGGSNPALTIDASAVSAATGLFIQSKAAGGGVTIFVTSSGTNENLTISAKGSGTLGLGSFSTGAVNVSPALNVTGLATFNGGLVITPGAAPGSPVNGQIWTTTASPFAQINGATKTLAALETAQTWTAVQTFNGGVIISGGTVQITSSYLITPAVYGGGTASSTLSLFSTFGAGTTDSVGIYTGSQVLRWKVDTNGHLLAGTDNSYDVGASGATRPRNIFVAGYTMSPTVYGGSATSGTLTLASTSGAGATDAINLQTGSQVTRWTIPNAGHLLTGVDNTYDIGASGATRPRTVYIGTGLNVAGNAGLSVTKTVRASGGAADCTLIYTGGILTGGTC